MTTIGDIPIKGTAETLTDAKYNQPVYKPVRALAEPLPVRRISCFKCSRFRSITTGFILYDLKEHTFVTCNTGENQPEQLMIICSKHLSETIQTVDPDRTRLGVFRIDAEITHI